MFSIFKLMSRFRVNRQRVKISRLAETLGHQLDAFGVLASRCGWLVQGGISKGLRLRGVLLRQVKGEQRRRDREVGRGREGDKARERETEIKREAPSFLPRLCLLFDVRREKQRRRAGERRREREKDRGR